jgi:PTH1 family peptidyl-tRNA hydrolase
MDRPEIKMVIGLGNPGRKYAATRHNLGFKVIDALAERLDINVTKRKFNARLGEGEVEAKKLILLKPMRFMNLSGQVAATAAGFYRLQPADVLVVSDDMALPTGKIRLKAKGSAGGHKGLADVLEKLGTENVPRLRIGIGPPERQDAVDYVLDRPASEERRLLVEAVAKARDAVLCWLEFEIETAMNRFNSP